jgi:hypothetical protein
MTIEPDTKDWTWVLHEPCPACGFDAGTFPVDQVADRVRADLPRWEAVLARPGADQRPEPGTWSPVEYACHVRDVFAVFGERLQLMLDTDEPTFANWDQDAAAASGGYEAQRPAQVGGQLVDAGRALASVVEAVPGDAWQRRGRRSNGSEFTVTTLLQYFLHDAVHHLHDVRG